jgi:hypothetical protein
MTDARQEVRLDPVAKGVRGAAQEGHVEDPSGQDQQLDGARQAASGERRPQEALSIPLHDLKWPLGGWLRLVGGRSEQAPFDSWAGPLYGSAAYDGPNGLHVIVTIDSTPRFGPLLHCSISHHKRDPFWHEIKAMREVFIPTNIDAMMMLPKAADYVNLHPHTFHVVQCPSAWDMQ